MADLHAKPNLEPADPPAPAPVAVLNVLYSALQDVYQVPSCAQSFWLSTMVYYQDDQHDSVATADGLGYRRKYAQPGMPITPGSFSALPQTDPLVADYLYACPTATPLGSTETKAPSSDLTGQDG